MLGSCHALFLLTYSCILPIYLCLEMELIEVKLFALLAGSDEDPEKGGTSDEEYSGEGL